MEQVNSKHKKKSILLNEVQNGEYMYFIHSYRPVDADPSLLQLIGNYAGRKFPVISKKKVFWNSFHPENQIKKVPKILRNFIRLMNPN